MSRHPAVMAIIAIAAVRIARSTSKRDPVLWGIALLLAVVTAAARAEIVWLFIVAGVFGAIFYGGGLPRLGANASAISAVAVVKGFALTGSGVSLGSPGLFFVKAGAFTFGSGLAIVPFLHEGLVQDPGGLLIFGLVGAVVATVAVFLPVYLFVVPGRLICRHERHPRVQGFVKGATARRRRVRSPEPSSSSACSPSAGPGGLTADPAQTL